MTKIYFIPPAFQITVNRADQINGMIARIFGCQDYCLMPDVGVFQLNSGCHNRL